MSPVIGSELLHLELTDIFLVGEADIRHLTQNTVHASREDEREGRGHYIWHRYTKERQKRSYRPSRLIAPH